VALCEQTLYKIVHNCGAMGAFWLRTQVCFVTWCRSRISDVNEFKRLLLERMPVGTQVFGCREYHSDGFPHFHAVVCFATSVYWQDAAERFWLRCSDGSVDTQSVHFKVPKSKADVERFLHFTQRYCAKNANKDLFGERIVLPVAGGTVVVRCTGCEQQSKVDCGWLCSGCASSRELQTEKVTQFWSLLFSSSVVRGRTRKVVKC
jgi:hypothetical protein